MKFILLFIGILSLLWIFLLWFALPKFGKKSAFVVLFFSILLIGSRLLRLYPPRWHLWNSFIESQLYYYLIVLPTTVFFVTLLLSLGIAPIWVILGRWAQKKKSAPTFEKSLEQIEKSKNAQENLSLENSNRSNTSHPSRRQILNVLSWAGPGAALLSAGYGVGIEAQRLTVRRLKLFFPHLPDSLQGFKIGQLTDSHISHDFTLIQTLEAACDLLAKENLDLLTTTGDLCDHRPLFVEVTRLLSQIPTKFGHYACLGNHELHVGLKHVRKAHHQSSLHLLENEQIQIGDLTLAGINYPARDIPKLGADGILFSEFLQKALPAQNSEAQNKFSLLLSHHPHVIEKIPQHPSAVDLVLSGHMHGGQVSLGERSLVEPFLKYTKGLYQIESQSNLGKQTQLFVSNGMGHWLPFRVHCPPEVVIIELAKKV